MNNLIKEDVIAAIEAVLVTGNLSSLTSSQRLEFYNKTCESLRLNPLTKPFEYMTLNGKLTMYAKKDATDQLRKIHGVSITKLERSTENGIHMVIAYASDASGRIGAVNITGLKGDALANAFMKAETKAKRRVTLSITGLGILDETELETIRNVSPAAPMTITEAVNQDMKETFEKHKNVFGLDGKFMESNEAHEYLKFKIEEITNLEALEDYKHWKELHKKELSKFAAQYPSDASELGDMFRSREAHVYIIEANEKTKDRGRFEVSEDGEVESFKPLGSINNQVMGKFNG